MDLYFTRDMSEPPVFNMSDNVGSQNVLTGISIDSFRAIPFANDFVTADGYCLDKDPDLRSYARVLEMGGGGGDTHPGSLENQMILRFDIPKAYDVSVHEFRVPPAPPGSAPVKVIIDMSSHPRTPENYIQVTVSDLFGVNPVCDVNTTGEAYVDNGVFTGFDATGERFGVHLRKMNPSVLYYNVNVSLIDPNIKAGRSDIPLERVFTFLQYEIVSRDGRFYAIVKPYPGEIGYYMLKSGVNPNDLSPAVTMYSDGKTPLMMPLRLNAEIPWEDNYQVLFSQEPNFTNPNKLYIYSQKLHFKADIDNMTVGVPNNFKIDKNYSLIPRPEANGEQADLVFTARWDIGYHRIIKELVNQTGALEIQYRIDKATAPNNTNPDLFDIITARIFSTGSTLDLTTGAGLYIQFEDESGRVLNTSPEPLKFRTDEAGGGVMYTYYAEVSFKAPAALKGANLPIETEIDFLYPNIYFLNVKPITVNGAPVDITASLYDSMTLNDISKLEVPPPQNFTAIDPVTTESPEEVSFKASFIVPGARIVDFISSQALYPDKDVKMNLYICQSERTIREQFLSLENLTNNKGQKLSRFELYELRKDKSIDAPYLEAYGNTLYFSSINGHEAMAIDESKGDKDAREALRKGKIVRVSNISLSREDLDSLLNERASFNEILKLDGMDKNQKYFLCADILLTIKDAGGEIRVQDASRTSNIAGITTKGIQEIPGESEQVPSSPVLSKKDVGLSMATIMWNRIPPLSQNEQIEYEIIRLRNNQLNPALLNTRIPFESFYHNSLPADTDKAGWRTNSSDIEGYDGSIFTVLDNTKAAYKPGVDPIEFTDYTLTPNQIYFYYVRTVRVLGDERIVSVWSRISITSTPVDSPKNLKAEQGEAYDRMTETVFSFDAPIMDSSMLGSVFNLQYQLKEGGFEWQSPVTMAGLSESVSAEAGYRRYMYRLSGLKPGMLYSIRVRMIDANGDGSIYTNVIQIKTEIDQKSYDNNHKTAEWIEYIKKLLNDLLKVPYWTTRNSSGIFEAVYRPDMFEGLIRAGAAPILLAESSARQTTYYLPASAVNAANAAGKGIRIPHSDMEILLSPNALDGNYNDAVRSAMDKIKTGHIQDYYIKINIIWSSPRAEAGMENRRADVAITAVGSLSDIKQWNNELLNKLAEQVSNQASDGDLRDYIASGVDRNYRPERIVRFSDRIGETVKRELDRIADRDLKPALRYAFPLTHLEEPIIIIAKNLDTRMDTHAFRYENNGWAPRNVLNFGDDRAVSENKPGSYVFSGRMMNMPGLSDKPAAGSKNALAAKYHFEDFFNRGANVTATRFAVAGAAARIAGAPREAAPYKWLSEHMGLALSTYGPANPITRQEAMHILMNLYAYKTKTDVTSIAGTDFNLPALTENVKEEYLPALRAAYRIGLLRENTFSPNAWVSAGEIMDMIQKLNEMIGL